MPKMNDIAERLPEAMARAMAQATRESFSPHQAAEYIGMSHSSFYRLARKHIPAVRLGPNMVRFRRADLDEYLAARMEQSDDG